MDKEKLADKTKETDRILKGLATVTTLIGIDPAQALAGGWGKAPIGAYRGSLAFVDLDAAVKQPLALAEQLHILGKLDGRQEGYDLKTVTIPLGAVANQPVSGTLTVPAGKVFFLNAIRTTCPATGGANVITANWRLSHWADPSAAPNTAGQAYYAVDLNFGALGGNDVAEFHQEAPFFAITNSPWTLRLPAGTVLTATFTNTVAAAGAAVAGTIELFGFVGKSLVD